MPELKSAPGAAYVREGQSVTLRPSNLRVLTLSLLHLDTPSRKICSLTLSVLLTFFQSSIISSDHHDVSRAIGKLHYKATIHIAQHLGSISSGSMDLCKISFLKCLLVQSFLTMFVFHDCNKAGTWEI